jgi:type II secretory pathway pseudopilin PulG
LKKRTSGWKERFTTNDIIKDMKAFALIELIVYIAIFAIIATFLIGMLTTVTNVQIRQTSVNEVTEQLNFVSDTIQRTVQESSLINIPADGAPYTTLVLGVSDPARHPTQIYEAGGIIYLEEGANGPIPLTDARVNVPANGLEFRKFETTSGRASVRADITLEYVTTNPRAVFSRATQMAVTRVNAAVEFDDTLVPKFGNTHDLGGLAQQWKDGYFSGRVGIGINPAVPLHVYRGATGIIPGVNSALVLEDDDTNGMSILTGDLDYGFINFGDSVAEDQAQIRYDHSADAFSIRTNGVGNIRLHIDSTGNVGIGTETPANTLHVVGGTTINGGLTVTGKATITGGVDPPYISFSGESHESIREFAESVDPHEKVMQFWNEETQRLEVYVIEEDKFYTMLGEQIE